MPFCICCSQQPPSSAVMDQLDGSTPAETLQRVSASLGCSPTSAEVAAYLDEHDELRPLREKFLVPKIADLPPCESKIDSENLTVQYLFITRVICFCCLLMFL